MNTSLIESPNQKINNKTSKDPPRKKKTEKYKTHLDPKIAVRKSKKLREKKPDDLESKKKKYSKAKSKDKP